jgi:serine protease
MREKTPLRDRRLARRALVAVVTAAVGFAGAAAITAFARPSVDIVHGFGPDGDGRTRLVVEVPGGLSDAALSQLRTAPAVDSAQRLFTGAALVAGFGITPAEFESLIPGATVTPSPTGEVTAAPMNDPAWSYDGYNLSNNGSNADSRVQAAPVAGDDINAPAGWAASTGRGEVVAVLDTGMVNHEDLGGALWTNPAEPCGSTDADRDGYAGDCHGWNFYANTADVTNAGGDASHGTMVAGAVAARTGNGLGLAGVAPDATIMPLVVGSGEAVDMNAAAQAIYYAADHGAAVINGSWIGNGGASILQAAIDYADSKGTLVVVAAGNDSLDRDTSLWYPASLHAPNLIVVGATTANDAKANFSAYGATTVDLFAPGDLIFGPWWQGGYRLASGTSFASPEVAGAAVLYRAVYPDDTPAQIKARIMNDVTLVPGLSGRSVSGGRLSLTALGNTAAGITYTFSGMNETPGTISPTVVVNGSSGAGDYSVQLGLGMEQGGLVYALTQQDITLGGQTVATGDDGLATFDLGALPALASQVVAPSIDLAEGRYVLTAQTFLEGQPVGRAYAAPLIVSDHPVPSDPTPGTPVPSDPGSGSQPGTTDPGSGPQPGTTDPGSGSQPGTTDPGSGSQPGTTDPGSGSQPGTTDPGNAPQPVPTDPGGGLPPGSTGPLPSTPAPSLPGSGSQPGSTDPGSGSQPGSTDPGSGSQPGSTDPGSGSQPGSTTPGTSTPGTGGQTNYPGTGAFGITSISPSTVSTSGGTLVTITGSAIPAGATVRVGASASATVVTSSATQLSFTAPALVAGTYDVYVFAPDGTSETLAGGLTYVDTSGGSQPGSGSQPGGSDPGSQPGSPDPGNGAQPSNPSSGPAPSSTVSGPHGERLMYSARFASLGASIWGVNCAGTCSGLAV